MTDSGPATAPLRAIALLRWTLLLLAVLVAGQAALGFLGLFDGAASGVLLAVATLGVLVLGARALWRSRGRTPLDGWRPLETSLLTAVIAAIGTLIWVAATRSAFAYDSLSFHLYFPASWMQSGRLEIVPMVFGDVAPAYNPSNVALLSHLLMAPLRSGYLADCVQAVFAFVAVLAIYSTARELRAGRAGALGGALSFLLIYEVWVQATLSMVDLAVGALFLATLPFLLRLWRRPRRLDGAALCTAWGLFIGTKFVALPYSAPILLAAAATLWRHRDGLKSARRTLTWGVAGVTIIFVTGGFWYVRNLVATGNPVFPLHTNILGIWQLNGLYGSDLMRQWDYHLPTGNLGQLGEMLLGGGVGFALCGALALAVRRRGPELPLALLLVGVFWFWLPYQRSRFLFPIFGVVAIAQSVATRDARLGKLCWLLLGGSIAGALIQWPAAEKLALLAAGLAGAGLPWVARRVPLRIPALVGALVFAGALAAGLGPHRARYPGYSYGPEYGDAWRWVDENVASAHVAYTGSNLPYPLYGRNLSNRVSYANVALGPRTKVHEFQPERPARTPEPTPYRQGASYPTWLNNLRALGCDTLFVASMFPIVMRSVDHDAEGFPIERAWADEHPETFQLRYANRGVRIYAIVATGTPPRIR